VRERPGARPIRLPLAGWLAILALASPARAARDDLPPAPRRWVTDTAGLLSEGARDQLDARLEAYERQTGKQVVVHVGKTLDGVPIEDFAVRAFEAWGIGKKGRDDGLALFVFAEDRKLRIEVGYGLEGVVPDAIASRVISDVIAPRLRAGDADGAIGAGVDALLAAIEGRPVEGLVAAQAERPPPSRGMSGLEKLAAFVVACVFLFILVTNPRLALWLLINMMASGGRRHGGGGGGFGGFHGGGGRSGGGGASGGW
jgi:uncharacterized protein